MMVQLLIMGMVIFAKSRDFTMVGALTLGINSGAYVAEIFRNLREHGYDPRMMRLTVVGGGGCLIKNFADCDKSRITVIDDIRATAKGYERLATRQRKRSGIK